MRESGEAGSSNLFVRARPLLYLLLSYRAVSDINMIYKLNVIPSMNNLVALS